MSTSAADPSPSTAVIVFARAPVPGQVKRRLIPALGAQGTARLYGGMLERTAATAAASGLTPAFLYTTPGASHPLLSELRERHGLQSRVQRGVDLGQRMAAAFREVLREAGAAVLVGSDCPSLDVGDLCAAARWLGTGYDAVLGPAADGGYFLIGLRRPRPGVFRGVPWGSGQVLDATRARLRRLGLEWRELEVRRDVDRPDDLACLPPELESGRRRPPWT